MNGFTDDDFPMFPSSSRVQRAGGNRAGLYSRRKSPPRAPDDKGAGAGEKGRDGKPRRRKRGRPPKKSLSVAMGEAAAPEAKEAAPSRGREMSQAFSKFPFSIAQLEALKWIAERRSVSAAAKWSGLKETTLRVRIRSLQRALQMPLFSRTVEPWRLSEAGVILYHYRCVGRSDHCSAGQRGNTSVSYCVCPRLVSSVQPISPVLHSASPALIAARSSSESALTP